MNDSYIKTILNFIKQKIDKLSKWAVNPDWSQNDETAPDYVKNRPGGYEISKIEDTIVNASSEVYRTFGSWSGAEFSAYKTDWSSALPTKDELTKTHDIIKYDGSAITDKIYVFDYNDDAFYLTNDSAATFSGSIQSAITGPFYLLVVTKETTIHNVTFSAGVYVKHIYMSGNTSINYSLIKSAAVPVNVTDVVKIPSKYLDVTEPAIASPDSAGLVKANIMLSQCDQDYYSNIMLDKDSEFIYANIIDVIGKISTNYLYHTTQKSLFDLLDCHIVVLNNSQSSKSSVAFPGKCPALFYIGNVDMGKYSYNAIDADGKMYTGLINATVSNESMTVTEIDTGGFQLANESEISGTDAPRKVVCTLNNGGMKYLAIPQIATIENDSSGVVTSFLDLSVEDITFSDATSVLVEYLSNGIVVYASDADGAIYMVTSWLVTNNNIVYSYVAVDETGQSSQITKTIPSSVFKQNS